MKDLEPGRRVYYVLSRNQERPEQVYLLASVVRRTAKRVTIKLEGFRHVRSVSPTSVCLELPPGARVSLRIEGKWA